MLKPLIKIALKLLRIKVKTAIIQAPMGSHIVRTLKALDLYTMA